MSYTINNTRAQTIATITPGTVTNIGGLTLIGKNYTGYGELIADDFVKLLENQATNGVAPTTPLTGQCWYDIAENKIKVYQNDGKWQRLGVTVSSTEPQVNVPGSLWLDTNSNTLKVYKDDTETFIGFAKADDSLTLEPLIFKASSFIASGNTNEYTDTTKSVTVMAIVGADGQGNSVAIAVFSPTGLVMDAATHNTSTPASTPDTSVTPAVQHTALHYDIYQNFSAGTTGDHSLTAGLNLRDNYLNLPNADTAATANSVNNTESASQPFVFPADVILSDSGSPKTTSATTDQTIGTNLLPSAHNTYNLGSNGVRFATIYGTAVEAQYADIAERFAADSTMDPGTLVALGGAEEICKTVARADTNVFGVVSTRPGFKLNAGAGDDATHPYIAVGGRVPTKVKGKVCKGDRLVSSDIPGVAERMGDSDDYFAVMGRAIVDKTNEDIETIPVAIGVK